MKFHMLIVDVCGLTMESGTEAFDFSGRMRSLFSWVFSFFDGRDSMEKR